MANIVAETSWFCNILHELHFSPTMATIVYCDKLSAIYLPMNLVQHQRTKHIKIDIHFIREKVVIGDIRVLHVPTPS